MRPLPWLFRMGLFAVGFAVGLSNYRAPSTLQPLIVEVHLENVAMMRPSTEASSYVPCTVPVSDAKRLYARS